MTPDLQAGRRRYNKRTALNTAALAVALGVGTWLLAPLLLPVKPPPGFPALPDPKPLNASLRELIQNKDREARRKPGSADAVGGLGLVYHANLFFDQAAAAYRITARLEPRGFQWTYAQAVLYEENGAEKEQIEFLRQTLQLNPGHVQALMKLADAALKGGRLDESERNYMAAARVPGGGVSLHAAFGLGRTAARRRDWRKVIETAGPAAASYPQASPLHELLQEAYAAIGEKDRAEQARKNGAYAKWKTLPPVEDPFNQQLIDLCYSSTRLLKQAGLLSKTGFPDRAIELARKAAQAEPADADVRDYLARTLITFYGDQPAAIDEAMKNLEECLRLRPSDPVPLGGFADDFFKSPKPPAAVERLPALLSARSGVPGVHFFLGQAADALGETGQAAEQYRAALRENPNDSGAHNKLGLIAEAAGRRDEALAYFRKAIQLNPMNTAARLNLAIELMQRGSYPQGFRELDELLRINPHDAAAHFCMGFAFLSLKRTDEAIARFREGLLYKPGDAEARFGLSSALAMQGRRDEALAELRETLRIRPDHVPAQRLLRQMEM